MTSRENPGDNEVNEVFLAEEDGIKRVRQRANVGGSGSDVFLRRVIHGDR